MTDGFVSLEMNPAACRRCIDSAYPCRRYALAHYDLRNPIFMKASDQGWRVVFHRLIGMAISSFGIQSEHKANAARGSSLTQMCCYEPYL